MTLDAAELLTLTPEAQAAALLPCVAMVTDSYARRNRKLVNLRDELHSEALVALAEALTTFDPSRGTLPAYVISKVRFRLSDYYRSNYWSAMKVPKGTRVRVADETSVPKYATSTPPIALGDLIQQENLRELRAAWEKLQVRHQETLTALVGEGKTRADYARECGVTVSAIDHRYLQAVKKLRLLMGVSK